MSASKINKANRSLRDYRLGRGGGQYMVGREGRPFFRSQFKRAERRLSKAIAEEAIEEFDSNTAEAIVPVVDQ